MDFTNRINSIEANLDDLQAGLEACSRATKQFEGDTTGNGFRQTPLHHLIRSHLKDLVMCVRDQRTVIQELRRSVIKLRNEETARRAVRPPPRRLLDGAPRAR